MKIVRCYFCNEWLDPDHMRTWRFVHGWEQPRDEGGLHALALRRPQQRWACTPCVERERKGVAAGQLGFE